METRTSFNSPSFQNLYYMAFIFFTISQISNISSRNWIYLSVIFLNAASWSIYGSHQRTSWTLNQSRPSFLCIIALEDQSTIYFRNAVVLNLLHRSDNALERRLDSTKHLIKNIITTSEKAEYFVNIFTGAARNFVYQNCNENMIFERLAEVTSEDYDSETRQLQVMSTPDNLRLSKFIK